MRPDPRWSRSLLLASLLGAGGCTTLAERIAIPDAAAPRLGPVQAAIERDMGITSHSTRIDEGLMLAWRLVPAADRGFTVKFAPDGRAFTMGPETKRAPIPLRPRGTIVYLHGWGMDASTMLLWAMAMAEDGYRGIAVDARGHGNSSSAPAGYGSRESEDLAALLGRLDEEGRLVGPVHLFGVSYGATTALLAEPRLRGRIEGIIALQPFANAADAVRNAIEGTLSMKPRSLRGRLALATMRLRYGHGDPGAAIREAGDLLDLDLASVDATPAAELSQTCTLLLHGADDTFVPPDASKQLAVASAWVRLHLMDREDHFSLPFRIDRLQAPVLAWLQSVESGECPQFRAHDAAD